MKNENGNKDKSNNNNNINNNKNGTLINFYCGLSAGIVSNFVCNPFDVVRINKQLSHPVKWNISFLSRGLMTGFITIPTFWSIYFDTYERLKFKNTGYFSIINGFIASNIASTITCPLFFIKLKNQTQPNFGIISFYKQNGIKPFYTGLNQTLIINGSFIIQMPLYEKFKENHKLKQLINNDTLRIFIVSAVSKIIASCVFYPMDTIRAIQRGNHKLTTLNIISNLNKNPLKYYSGMFVYLMRSIPYYSSTFCTFEYTKSTITKKLKK